MGDGVRDRRAVIHEGLEHHTIVRALEVHERPAFVRRLVLRGRPARRESAGVKRECQDVLHHAMHVGPEDSAAHDSEGVADVADGGAGNRLVYLSMSY